MANGARQLQTALIIVVFWKGGPGNTQGGTDILPDIRLATRWMGMQCAIVYLLIAMVRTALELATQGP